MGRGGNELDGTAVAERRSRRLLYHQTSAARLAAILEGGLQPGSQRNASGDNGWADEVYGDRPIYLSRRPWLSENYDNPDYVLLEVDVSGLELVADLPSLSDFGAYYDAESVYWEEETPAELLPFEADGVCAVSFDDLLDPQDAGAAAIALTGTAACLAAIGPERLRVVSPDEARTLFSPAA